LVAPLREYLTAEIRASGALTWTADRRGALTIDHDHPKL
jgi:hypothetical protein